MTDLMIQNKYNAIHAVKKMDDKQYWIVEHCVRDYVSEIINNPNRMAVMFNSGMLPMTITISPSELQSMETKYIACGQFDKDVAFQCIQDACARWSGICSSDIFSITATPQGQTNGLFSFYASNDKNDFRQYPNTVAISNTHWNIIKDNNVVRVFTDVPPYNPTDPNSKWGVIVNMTDSWTYSTDCPCSKCGGNDSYNICKVMQHEIGHLFQMKHSGRNCPKSWDRNGTMVYAAVPCSMSPTDPAACSMDLTCNDLCQYCKMHCFQDCDNVTAMQEIECVSRFALDAYPNPGCEIITIGITGKPVGDVKVTIIDNAGRLVSQQLFIRDISSGAYGTMSWNVQNLRKGVYHFRCDDRDGSVFRSVVVK